MDESSKVLAIVVGIYHRIREPHFQDIIHYLSAIAALSLFASKVREVQFS